MYYNFDHFYPKSIVTVAFHALFHLLSTLICNTNIIT